MLRWRGILCGLLLLSLWSLSSWTMWRELTALRQQLELQTANLAASSSSAKGRRLAELNVEPYSLAGPASGCVIVDTSNGTVTLNLDSLACGGGTSRCPPCFGLRATAGVVIHSLVLANCSEMRLGATQQLGTDPYQNSLQPITFMNQNNESVAAVSDGTNHFLIPPGAREVGYCHADGGDALHLDESLRKYLHPGSSWTVLGNAEWTDRSSHAMVVRHDGALVIAGGSTNNGDLNDVWASANGGYAWVRLVASAPWSTRSGHGMAVRPDNALVLAGGADVNFMNDAWASADGGSSWAQLSPAGGNEWAARAFFGFAVRQDGDLVLAGGFGIEGGSTLVYHRDVWVSPDGGSTWGRVTPATGAPWTARASHAMAVRLDGALVLAGGSASGSALNDVWMSADGGTSWTALSTEAPWSARSRHAMAVRLDGALVITGGFDQVRMGDSWASTDGGATWSRLVDGNTLREQHAMAVRPDGALLLAGGRGAEGGSTNAVIASLE